MGSCVSSDHDDYWNYQHYLCQVSVNLQIPDFNEGGGVWH